MKNNIISILRVFAMLCVVLIHVIGYYDIPGSPVIVQCLLFANPLFFFISGYLYGGKIITNWREWLVKRWKKICIPMIIVVVVDVIALAISRQTPDTLTIVAYLFSLEGLLSICRPFFSIYIHEISNLGPLWFASVIMFCYLLTPFFQKILSRYFEDRKWCKRKSICIVSIVLISFLLYLLCEIDLSSIVVYFWDT